MYARAVLFHVLFWFNNKTTTKNVAIRKIQIIYGSLSNVIKKMAMTFFLIYWSVCVAMQFKLFFKTKMSTHVLCLSADIIKQTFSTKRNNFCKKLTLPTHKNNKKNKKLLIKISSTIEKAIFFISILFAT